MERRYLGIDVLNAAKNRISWAFDTFDTISVSFSGGKDSTVMLHLVADEARRRNRMIHCLFVDWEAQYSLTIQHVNAMFSLYNDVIIPYWIALPFKTVNAVSQFEPEWMCWDPDKKDLWVRDRPENAITDEAYFPFYTHGMTFEEFMPAFSNWLGKSSGIMIGIRVGESMHRYRTLFMENKTTLDNKQFTTKINDSIYNCYPIYDWTDSDIWAFHGITGSIYNKLYDRMHQAGLPLKHMRVCEPYGLEQRVGLWLYHAIEPETWGKIVARVNGANQGALYAKTKGNIMGNGTLTLPAGHTWKSFALQLLESMPVSTSDHYKNKIAVYLKWYSSRGYQDGIPDAQENDLKHADKSPSWRRICKTILMNDYWCRSLSFSPTKSSAYTRYLDRMKQRREEWNLI